MITGWSFTSPKDEGRGGEFVFNERAHEPGEQILLGKRYEDGGIDQGRAALLDLARHPATAAHIASKLALHFVSDKPPPALVERLSRSFHETGGDLKQLAEVLVRSEEAWGAPREKLKRPGEWIIGIWRAGNMKTADHEMIMRALAALGEPLWRPPSPKGFPDDSASWIDGLAQRLDIAAGLARDFEGQIEPSSQLDDLLEPPINAVTRQAIGNAASRKQALTLLFMAPEFLRR
jgi:uncharacterized protein (DUF1800 family)